jgi:hypothetical protein
MRTRELRLPEVFQRRLFLFYFSGVAARPPNFDFDFHPDFGWNFAALNSGTNRGIKSDRFVVSDDLISQFCGWTYIFKNKVLRGYAGGADTPSNLAHLVPP